MKKPKIFSWERYPYPEWWDMQKEVYNPEAIVCYETIDPWDDNPTPNWFMGFSLNRGEENGTIYIHERLHEVIWTAHGDGFMIGEGWGFPLEKFEKD